MDTPLTVHQLLCKKVAQLTKVIYQLNTKAEDRDVDLNLVARSFDSEVEQMARQSEERVREARAQLQRRQGDLETEIARLLGETRRLEQEKQAFIARFQAFKTEADARLARFQDATRQRVDQLVQEVDALRRDNADAFRSNRKASKDELDRLSRELNEQNAELARELAAARAAGAEHEAAVGRLQAELAAKAAALDAAGREHAALAAALRADKHAASESFDRRLLEMTTKLAQAQTAQMASADQIAKLLGQIDADQADLRRARADGDAQDRAARLAAEALEATVGQLRRDVAERDARLEDAARAAATAEAAQARQRESDNIILSLKASIEEYKQESRQLQEAFASSGKTLETVRAEAEDARRRLADSLSSVGAASEAEQRLRLAHENASKEAAHFRAEMSRFQAAAEDAERRAGAERAEHAKTKDLLGLAKATLESRAASLEAEAAALRAQLAERDVALQKALEERDYKYGEYEGIVATGRAHAQRLEAQLADAREEFRRHRELNASSASAKEDEYVARINALAADLDRQAAEHADLLAANAGLHADLEAHRAEKERLQEHARGYAERLGALQAEVGAIQSCLRQLDVGSARAACETLSEAFSVSVATAVEAIRNAVRKVAASMESGGQTAAAAARAHEEALAALEEQLAAGAAERARLEAALAERAQALRAKEDEAAGLTTRVQDLLSRLASGAESAEATAGTIDRLTRELAEQRGLAATQGERAAALECELEAARKGACSDREALVRAHKALVSDKDAAISDMAGQAEALRREVAALQDAMVSLREEHQRELDGEMAAMQSRHQEELDRLREALGEWELKHAGLAKEHAGVSELLREANGALEAMERSYEQRVAALAEKLEEHEQGASALQMRLRSSEAEGAATQGELARVATALQLVKEQLAAAQRDSAAALARARETHEQALDGLRATQEEERAVMQSTLTRMTDEHRQKQAELEDQIRALHAEIEDRPSRPEDVDRIQQLAAMVDDLQRELQVAAKAVAYYKRELLSREDAYNKRFAEKPARVGAMQIPGVPAHVMNATQNSTISSMLGGASPLNLAVGGMTGSPRAGHLSPGAPQRQASFSGGSASRRLGSARTKASPLPPLKQ